MPAGPSHPTKKLLLVDDEEALVWSLSSRLGKARPSYLVDTAHDGATALEKIHRSPVDLLVADIRMPGMSGIDLIIEARRLQPSLPVVMMTAFKTPDALQLANAAATSFLDKPFEFERFLSVVDAALATKANGFSGAISVQTLPDIVQLYLVSNATGALRIRHGHDEGEIWFREARIVHATHSSGLEGEEAFYAIMVWSGGDFSMRVGAQPVRDTIANNPTELLMESCRLLDERRYGDGIMSQRTGWTITPPSDPESLFGDDFGPSAPSQPAPSAPQASPQSPARAPSPGTQSPPPTQTSSPNQPPKENTMNIKDSLAKLNNIDGFIGAALVDGDSGMLLGHEGGGSMNLEIAAAGNTEVVKSKRKTISNLGLKESIEDILISLTKQYHLIRPLRSRPTLFFYVALDRSRANLAMARIALADVEQDLQVLRLP
jgi:DNA-binding response OmpR family regulator/predicted regulator of Ras-like GTPase activity (Roadblock/LC7/MglB family)